MRNADIKYGMILQVISEDFDYSNLCCCFSMVDSMITLLRRKYVHSFVHCCLYAFCWRYLKTSLNVHDCIVNWMDRKEFLLPIMWRQQMALPSTASVCAFPLCWYLRGCEQDFHRRHSKREKEEEKKGGGGLFEHCFFFFFFFLQSRASFIRWLPITPKTAEWRELVVAQKGSVIVI